MTRVRVTAPRGIPLNGTALHGTAVHGTALHGTAVPAARSSADARDAAEESDAGQVFVRSLIRSQLRLGLVVAGGFLLILLAFPLMLGLVPGLAQSTIAGLPFDWVLLGAGIYPVIGLSAWLYVRTAARNEARYRDLAGDK
ncbi:hypothetical protein QFZ79_004365 [Arthrobacter sp. V4I6]|uniref:hypothetical protein n=1 Tax=unclassified Arthrobacter TaxID=235627 RepID=UPI00278B1470|nr:MULTISPECIES: hypothetical protein [unclassified Arthrobacter]MDQ0821985.1 hypothetical protein [Arthrobacter sp. V1I7]MDQ0856254.1 hypothetical protein [Arthrobacter sp. V4I6]